MGSWWPSLWLMGCWLGGRYPEKMGHGLAGAWVLLGRLSRRCWKRSLPKRRCGCRLLELWVTAGHGGHLGAALPFGGGSCGTGYHTAAPRAASHLSKAAWKRVCLQLVLCPLASPAWGVPRGTEQGLLRRRLTSPRLCCRLGHCTKHGENSSYCLKNSYKSPPACFGMGNAGLWHSKLVQRETCSQNLVALCAGTKSWFGVTGKKDSGAGG